MVQAGVVLSVRRAGVDDLGAIEGLARRRRESLAVWSPTWWRPSSSADEAHRQWLSFLVTSGHADCRVVLDGVVVVGCAVVVGQPSHALVDDLAVDNEDRWPSVLVALAAAVSARPALSCVPTADTPATAVLLWSHGAEPRTTHAPMSVPVPGVVIYSRSAGDLSNYHIAIARDRLTS